MNNEREQNVLIVGGGGREDALAWKLRQSPRVGNIFIGPGNGGTGRFADTKAVHLNPDTSSEIIQASKDFNINLVIIGPENPLIAGVADDLRKENISTFGPGEKGAKLEGSKAEAVIFMKEFGIPHPPSEIFENHLTASQFIKSSSWWEDGGMVIKADGPAGGKGVIVCDNKENAQEALEKIIGRVVIQKKLRGYEVSVMAIVANNRYILLPASEDYKQVFDDDQGPNTGGMGTVAPHPLMKEDLDNYIEKTIIRQTLSGLKKRGIDFRGIIYPGIMVTQDGPVVLEYNTRFGDPETEAVLPLLKNDLFPVLQSAAKGNLFFDGKNPSKSGYCLVVTLASGGYPGHYEKGIKILGLNTSVDEEGVIIYHAGTEKKSDGLYSAGGRVLMVAGLGESIQNARDKAYGAIGEGGISFREIHFRKDIGARKRSI